MPQSPQQIRRAAKRLFRWCRVNGDFDQQRARRVTELILSGRRRGYVSLLSEFGRLLKLELSRHQASVQSAKPLSADLQTRIRGHLQSVYGPDVGTEFHQKAELIGGIRIQIGSDVYDNSVRSKLTALKRSFGILPGKRTI